MKNITQIHTVGIDLAKNVIQIFAADCEGQRVMNRRFSRNKAMTALALRDVLGPIKFEAAYPDIGKPYYIVRSSINTLAIIDPPSKPKCLDNGSPVLRWWARKECIRTLGILKIHCEFQRCVATK